MEAANVSSDHPLSVFKIFIVGFAAMAGFSCATSGIEVKVEMYASVPDESGKGCRLKSAPALFRLELEGTASIYVCRWCIYPYIGQLFLIVVRADISEICNVPNRVCTVSLVFEGSS
ncbi:hypothetical protein T4B_6791 [Trichinella pseudospiralis]|uniref:Uncharacterized protein n=1 Tax=Trichinella pseudospiralis TaxID=6337 RepID=A0A0V0XM47_TRIPS|nr:hypothetical protein T4E_5660 [Trichinella pseudospiralis]KRY75839.1 hypothetical protein T4A_5855 [Trichinella pseudospiralis]KRZ11840.1 hypothetical protein T4B_6791 [Trichinella pseudospiralis]KRZ29598.1 hypothetical protein T4C_5413 [Trichinella pseudospiralis]